MSSPTFPQLGASTLVRKWIFEVNTGTLTVPNFVMVGGVTNSAFNPDAATLEDDSDMQSGGAGSQTKTAGNASATLTLSRKVIAATPGSYDVGQEFLRSKAIGKYGAGNSVQMRISEFSPDAGSPRVEAYLGLFAVQWDNQGGGNTGLDTTQVTLAGQGRCAPIAHPYPGTATVPTVEQVQPATAGTAGGTSAIIKGIGFTGVTGASHVTIGGTNATSYSVLDDNTISAVVPANSAGNKQVVVTNVTGASTDLVNIVYS